MTKILIRIIVTSLGLVFAVQAYANKKDRNPKLSEEELKKRLTPIQYHVTQKGGTEKPFDNKYWNHKEPGIYVDIVTGEALFSSKDKFDSKSGWPSFTRPIEEKAVETRIDRSLFMTRIEALSKEGKSHLGHIFDDGPEPTGKRYCNNGICLIFRGKE